MATQAQKPAVKPQHDSAGEWIGDKSMKNVFAKRLKAYEKESYTPSVDRLIWL